MSFNAVNKIGSMIQNPIYEFMPNFQMLGEKARLSENNDNGKKFLNLQAKNHQNLQRHPKAGVFRARVTIN